MAIDPHAAALKRQVRRAFILGFLGVAVGAAGAIGAIWLGLDLTGFALLATGLLVALLGLFLVAVGFYGSGVLLVRWLKEHLGRRSPRAAPTVQAPQPAAPSTPPRDGPRIF